MNVTNEREGELRLIREESHQLDLHARALSLEKQGQDLNVGFYKQQEHQPTLCRAGKRD